MSSSAVQNLHSAHVGSVWPPLTAAEIEEVLARFNLPVAGATLSWHSGRPLSAAAIVKLGNQEVFIKRHHRSVRTAPQLREEHCFIQHLHQRGAPVNPILAAPDGESAFALGEFTYEIQQRAEGIDLYRDLASWTPFKTLDHAIAAGRALALMHNASQEYSAPPRQARVLVSGLHVIGATDPLAAVQAEIEERPALRRYMARHPWRADLARALQPVQSDFLTYTSRLRPLWTHNDWHASNLLWSDDSQTATVRTIVDFGLCNRTTAIYDLATAIERNTIAWIDIQEGRPGKADLHLAKGLLQGYLSEAPLSPVERAGLVAILPIVHVEYALSEIEYFCDVIHAMDLADVAYHAFLLGHCAWFKEATGSRFLADLRAHLESMP